MKEDVLFFTNTESANFCDGIVGSSSFDNIPVDVERDIVFDEFPDIFTECGSLPILPQCCDVRVVLVVSGLHWVVSTTSIGFPLIGVCPGDSCLVHQVIHHAANTREYLAGFRCLLRFTGTSVCLGCCSIVVINAI